MVREGTVGRWQSAAGTDRLLIEVVSTRYKVRSWEHEVAPSTINPPATGTYSNRQLHSPFSFEPDLELVLELKIPSFNQQLRPINL